MQVLKFFVPRLFPDGAFLEPAQHREVLICRYFLEVSEGTRTPDRLDHNQELYQLSYAHHAVIGV